VRPSRPQAWENFGVVTGRGVVLAAPRRAHDCCAKSARSQAVQLIKGGELTAKAVYLDQRFPQGTRFLDHSLERFVDSDGVRHETVDDLAQAFSRSCAKASAASAAASFLVAWAIAASKDFSSYS
jgi:hypothetical protein